MGHDVMIIPSGYEWEIFVDGEYYDSLTDDYGTISEIDSADELTEYIEETIRAMEEARAFNGDKTLTPDTRKRAAEKLINIISTLMDIA